MRPSSRTFADPMREPRLIRLKGTTLQRPDINSGIRKLRCSVQGAFQVTLHRARGYLKIFSYFRNASSLRRFPCDECPHFGVVHLVGLVLSVPPLPSFLPCLLY